MTFFGEVHKGVKGIVKDSSNNPIPKAALKIRGRDMTFTQNGERILGIFLTRFLLNHRSQSRRVQASRRRIHHNLSGSHYPEYHHVPYQSEFKHCCRSYECPSTVSSAKTKCFYNTHVRYNEQNTQLDKRIILDYITKN
ncbi:hypothetical protein HNY73_020859 [Argiope bruennichi]|uniref:Uncharacterized protein n=1 Tax=Argiope bruennichi TaxID=94029 RepID=A0A8T0E8C3_ARGBR|nr:hypothetical protein HNY73_020859 [Argiope bruennichi]